jgi:hypothetical protein
MRSTACHTWCATFQKRRELDRQAAYKLAGRGNMDHVENVQSVENSHSLKDLSYRLGVDALAIRDFSQKERQSVTIPSGTTIRVVRGPYNGDLLLEVDWKGEIFLIFTDDVRNHATLV